MTARLFCFLPFLLAAASSLDLPRGGCHWTGCQSKWFGECGAGHVVADRSDNCDGLCSGLNNPPCLPFHTHFYCCIPEIPRVENNCTQCKNKMDFGKENVCCTDCSDPIIMNKETKLGYCKTGAELAMQLKPQAIFKWVAGPWMECSAPCDGGVRYRDVGCYGSTVDESVKHYPVADDSCSSENMPARQESCNLHSCADVGLSKSNDIKKSRVSTWFVAVMILLGLVVVGGIAFAANNYYMRSSVPRGFVYITLEGYS